MGIKKTDETNQSPITISLHLHPHSIGIGTELRRVEALDKRVAVTEVAFLGDEHAVFHLMRAFRQGLDEKLHAGVGIRLII